MDDTVYPVLSLAGSQAIEEKLRRLLVLRKSMRLRQRENMQYLFQAGRPPEIREDENYVGKHAAGPRYIVSPCCDCYRPDDYRFQLAAAGVGAGNNCTDYRG